MRRSPRRVRRFCSSRRDFRAEASKPASRRPEGLRKKSPPSSFRTNTATIAGEQRRSRSATASRSPAPAAPGTVSPSGTAAKRRSGFPCSRGSPGRSERWPSPVSPFPTTPEPIGFRLDTGEATLVHVTDFGHLSPEVAEAVSGASVLLIESNYDEQQLYESRYPFSTRQRIASTRGHLSNGALALYLRRRLPASVHTVLLAHLSANTNTPELALRTARTALDAARRPDVRLLVANRSALTEEVRTGTGEPSPLPHPNPLATGTRSLFHPA